MHQNIKISKWIYLQQSWQPVELVCSGGWKTPLLNQGISWTLRGRPRGFCYQPVGHNTSSPSNQNGITFSASWFSLGRSVKGLSTEKRPRKTHSAFLFWVGEWIYSGENIYWYSWKSLHHELNWEPKLIVTHDWESIHLKQQLSWQRGFGLILLCSFLNKWRQACKNPNWGSYTSPEWADQSCTSRRSIRGCERSRWNSPTVFLAHCYGGFLRGSIPGWCHGVNLTTRKTLSAK